MANLRFIVSLISTENDYQVEQAAAAQAAAHKLGVDLQILYADNDAITQSTQLLKAIQSDPALRPQAIILSRWEARRSRRWHARQSARRLLGRF